MVNYNERSVELVIKENNQKIEVFRWNCNDKQLEKKLFYLLRDKYGIFKKEEKNQDLDWLNKV